MAKGNSGNRGSGNRGRANYGRAFPVIGVKKRPGRPRKPRRALTTAGSFPVGYALPEPSTTPEEAETAEEVAGDVDDVAELENQERAEGRTTKE